MSQIWIKYSDDNWSTSTTASFSAVRDRIVPSVIKERGTTMRGVEYSHVLHKQTKRQIVISADELWDPLNKVEIRNIWQAGALKYSNDNSTFVDVVIDPDGDYSPDFIEDDESLEEFEFTIIYKEPN